MVAAMIPEQVVVDRCGGHELFVLEAPPHENLGNEMTPVYRWEYRTTVAG